MDKNQKTPPPKDEIDVLVCARTADNPDVLQGSIWDKCRECGATVWISLSGQRALKENLKLVPCCMECATKKHFNSGEVEIKAAPGSLQEVRNYLATRKQH